MDARKGQARLPTTRSRPRSATRSPDDPSRPAWPNAKARSEVDGEDSRRRPAAGVESPSQARLSAAAFSGRLLSYMPLKEIEPVLAPKQLSQSRHVLGAPEHAAAMARYESVS